MYYTPPQTDNLSGGVLYTRSLSTLMYNASPAGGGIVHKGQNVGIGGGIVHNPPIFNRKKAGFRSSFKLYVVKWNLINTGKPHFTGQFAADQKVPVK